VAAPSGMQGVPGDKSVTLYWRPNPQRVNGYNVYMAYKLEGPWYKLTSRPLQVTAARLSAYNTTQYFAVTAISPRAPFLESLRSVPVKVTPRPGLASAFRPALPQAAPARPAGVPASAPPALPGAGPSAQPAARPSGPPGLPPLP
jgi:hypothetical protein